MRQPKHELNDGGVDAPDQDWQWDLLERNIEQQRTGEGVRKKAARTLTGKEVDRTEK